MLLSLTVMMTVMIQSKMIRSMIVIVTVMVVSGAVEVNTAKVVDGGWTKFNKTAEVGPCRCVSGSGFKERIWRRTCTKPKPRGGGNKCKGRRKVVRIENCDSSICNVKEEVAWGEWSEFGRCSSTCGPGIRSRWRYWNEFDPVKKKTNTENILCHNPHCPISFSLRGESYQLISRLQGYKWDIGPGWGFVCNDDPVVGELLEAVEAMKAAEGNNQSNMAMQLIEGTAMFVKQAPLNSGEEAWQYIEVDDPQEEVEILNWEFVPINNSNIVDYQKQMCHLLSSPEEAEKMNRGLLKIFRKKSSTAEPLSGNVTSSNSKLIKALHGGSGEDEPFRGRKVKNYRIPSRDLNRMSSRKPFNWREKGLDPDLQPLEPRLSERIRMSSFPDNNERIGSSPNDGCHCINGTALFLASHRLMERGFGVVSGKTKCECAQNQDRPQEITTQQYNGSQTSSYGGRTSSSVEVSTPGYNDDQTFGSYEDHIPPSTANATDLYTMDSPLSSDGDGALGSPMASDGHGSINSPITRNGDSSNGDGSKDISKTPNDSHMYSINGDVSEHFTEPPNDSHIYINNGDASEHFTETPNDSHIYINNGVASEHFIDTSNDSHMYSSNGDVSEHFTETPNDSHIYINNGDASEQFTDTPIDSHMYSRNGDASEHFTETPNDSHIYINNGVASERFIDNPNDSHNYMNNGDASEHFTDTPNDSHMYSSNGDASAHFTDTPNDSRLYSNNPLTSTAVPIQVSTVAPPPCPPPETIMERCVWLTSITKQEESFHIWDQDGDGLLTAEEWMNGRKGKNCISATAMKYYVEEAIKTIKRFNGDGIKTKATFLEFYAINRGTSHAFDC